MVLRPMATTIDYKRVSKWGDSLAVTLSPEVIAAAALRKGDYVKITVAKNGRITIEKANGEKGGRK